MAHCKTTQHKKVMRVQPRKHYEIDWMLERSSESHDNRRTADYFLRELRSLLRTLDYHAEPSTLARRPRCAARATGGRCILSCMGSPKAPENAVYVEHTMPLH
jgi:hypothetical protein